VTAKTLDEAVLALINPHGHGRQWVASFLAQHTGTHAGGYTLTAQKPPSRWGTTSYALKDISPKDEPN
jgi:hypothetical protein